jgi:hypothetical protein
MVMQNLELFGAKIFIYKEDEMKSLEVKGPWKNITNYMFREGGGSKGPHVLVDNARDWVRKHFPEKLQWINNNIRGGDPYEKERELDTLRHRRRF